MGRPRILVLFCGGGGSSAGYHRAGFSVIGVDIVRQRRYPFEWVQADALRPPFSLREFDAIHASPPCQRYTSLRAPSGSGEPHPDLIGAVRALLVESGKPYVIENVVRAPLRDPIMLCGRMFGLRLFRHRLFESNVPLTAPQHQKHVLRAPRTGRRPREGEVYSLYGHFAGVREACEAMEVPWMGQKEAAQAVPPAYTAFIGAQLMQHLRAARLE